MAVFDVCASVNVLAGQSFQWSNIGRTAAVKITPASGTSWPLPQNEYDIAAGGTSSAITVPAATPSGNYFFQVHWQLSTTPGQPCSATGGNPKIIVGDHVPATPKY